MGLFGLFGKKKKEDNTLQDAPGNSKKENNAAEGEQKNRTGGFVSFVLLSEPRWDKDAFFRTLREEGKLTPDAEDEDEAGEEKGRGPGGVFTYWMVPAGEKRVSSISKRLDKVNPPVLV